MSDCGFPGFMARQAAVGDRWLAGEELELWEAGLDRMTNVRPVVFTASSYEVHFSQRELLRAAAESRL